MKAATHHKIWIVITIALAILAYALVNGCTTVVEQPLALRPGDTACDTTDHTSSSSAGEASSGSTGDAFTCPALADGDVEFCLPDHDCRTVYFAGVADASTSSTLAIYWPGTYEWQVEPPTAATPWNFMGWAGAVDALVAVPRPDAAAVARTNNPFPWWAVCGQTNPSGCNRDDDFVLAEAVAQCAVEQGLASPQRLTSAGMSAGAIMTSFLIERGLGDLELAAAVSWSGGQPAAAQPTVPASDGTAVFVLHGGTADVYCGIGNLPGTCGGYTPYAFSPPSVALANDVAAAGNFAVICNHHNGHNADMPIQGEEFIFNAVLGAHPWAGFTTYGAGGNVSGWPGMTYSEWMLRYSDCAAP